jgi:2-phosphosulfolactate phosphatase
MKIEILEFVEGARLARGFTVIIDVFRAFSVACYAFDGKASALIATAGIEEAFRLRNIYPGSVLVGERSERKVEGFDFGNSPTEIISNDIRGKTVIHTTTAGTAGLVNAVNADMITTGSFVNAGAVIKYIKEINPGHVSLVAMGYRANESAAEDLLCAEMIAAGLRNADEIPEARISDLQHTSGKRFFIPGNTGFSPPSDFFLCTMVNRFNFVLLARKRPDGNVNLEKLDA